MAPSEPPESLTIDQFNTMLIETPHLFPEANLDGDFLYNGSSMRLVKRPGCDSYCIIKQTEAYFYAWFPMAQAFYLSAAFNLQRNEFMVSIFLH